MVLNGQMSLKHESQHESSLGKYDVDRFDGGWNTSSKGKCTDFNLMTKGETKGDVSGCFLPSNSSLACRVEGKAFFYLLSGHAKIQVEGQMVSMKTGFLLTVNELGGINVVIRTISKCEWVIVEIEE